MGWFGGFTLETYNRIPGDYADLTVGGAAAVLPLEKVKPTSGAYARLSARAAMLSLEEGEVRFRIDGGAPAANRGHLLTSGDTIVLSGTQALTQFQAIRAGEVNGTLRVTYFY